MIEVERTSADRLCREVWRFYISVGYSGNVCTVRLSYYGRQARDSTRHKFRSEPQDQWDSYDQRSYHSGIKAEEVPLPDDVISEAKTQVILEVKGAVC